MEIEIKQCITNEMEWCPFLNFLDEDGYYCTAFNLPELNMSKFLGTSEDLGMGAVNYLLCPLKKEQITIKRGVKWTQHGDHFLPE